MSHSQSIPDRIITNYRVSLTTWLGKLLFAGAVWYVISITVSLIIKHDIISTMSAIESFFLASLFEFTFPLDVGMRLLGFLCYMYVWHSYSQEVKQQYRKDLHRKVAELDAQIDSNDD